MKSTFIRYINVAFGTTVISITSAFAAPIYTCTMVSTSAITNSVQYKVMNCNSTTQQDVKVYQLTASSADVVMKNIGLSSAIDKTLQTLPNIAIQSNDKSKIIAGVNGGFFNMVTQGYKDDMCPAKSYTNYGEGNSYLYINGQDWAKNCENRPVMAYAPGDLPMLIPNVGKTDSLNGFGSYITSAGGGGPILVKDGNISIDNGKYPWVNQRAARTAIGTYGTISSGRIFLIVVDAIRGNKNTGMTIPELADFMKYTLNASNAMNLDGGGSSTMCITKNSKCDVVNIPTNTAPRNIHDGLFILSK